MKSTLKESLRHFVLIAFISYIFVFNGKDLTNFFFNTFGFIEAINPNIGWLILILAIGWVIEWRRDCYTELTIPLFYVSFIFWLSLFWGDINPNLGLTIGMLVLLLPNLSNLITLILNLNKPIENKSILQYDHSDENTPLYEGRQELVNIICTEIKNLHNNKFSFTIGLEGSRGAGKSTLINAITRELEKTQKKDDSPIVIIHFHPWAFPEGKNLSVEFLYEIRKVLIKHSFQARFVINSYINVLVGGYSSGVFRMVTNLIFPRESLTSVKKKLSNIIVRHRLKLVVVVEDLDRLDKDEIAETFKMLRNTGDIANTVYIVAYNKQNVEKRENEFSLGYLDKIFNADIDLPPMQGEVLLNNFIKEIKEYFDKAGIFKEDSNLNILTYLQEYPDIVKDFSNLRDIKKLSNNIKIRIEHLKKITSDTNQDIYLLNKKRFNKNFLFFLEMVRLKDHLLYVDIKNQNMYKDNYSNSFEINFFPQKGNVKNTNGYKLLLYRFLSFNHLPASDYLSRLTLKDYFASTSNQIVVTHLLGECMDSKQKSTVTPNSYLADWKTDNEQFDWAIAQIPVLIRIAKESGKSENLSNFIKHLILDAQYCECLKDELTNYCYNHKSKDIFNDINDERIDYKPKILSEEKYKKQTLIDEIYNKLVIYINKDTGISPSELITSAWHSTILQGQSERLEFLLKNTCFKEARNINCGRTNNVRTDRKSLHELAVTDPKSYFTQLLFFKNDDLDIEFNPWSVFFHDRTEFISYLKEIGKEEQISTVDKFYKYLYQAVDYTLQIHPHKILDKEEREQYEKFISNL